MQSKFVVRLRGQAKKCKFNDANEHIIDQITEKCRINKLRKKILLMANETINLNTIIAETNALEAVTRQLEDFSRTKAKQEINKLEMAQKNIKTKCLRCGSVNHLAEDKNFQLEIKNVSNVAIQVIIENIVKQSRENTLDSRATPKKKRKAQKSQK